MNNMLSMTLSLILGTVFVVNGLTANTDKIINEAKTSVNAANLHQLATVLELYYSDHETYPNVSSGEALIETLEDGNYIMNRPLDPSVFSYEVLDRGENYRLAIRPADETQAKE